MAKLSLFISIIMLSIVANGQTVGFTFAASSGVTLCSPATVNFTQTCTGNPIGYSWYFSNGIESNEPNPSIVFAAGAFTARLVAVFETGTLETTQSFTVNPSINATLTADRNYICQPGNINFTAAAAGNITTYEWAFGDGTTAINTSATITHPYTALGSFIATVKVIETGGCSATATYTITVQNPPISASVTPINVCAPANASFAATVTVPTGSTVTNYNWAFGDGSPATNTNVGTEVHVYADSGSYVPILNITTSEGCTNTFTYPKIAYGIPPTNHIAYAKKTVYCGSETAQLVAKATLANAYRWNFGDGIIETITDTLAQHKYTTLGVKNITVTPLFNGCAGTPISFNIDIVGVIASFTYANTCAAKKTFALTNTSLGILSSSIWSFGDLTPNVISTNTTHTYPPSGAFPTQLTVVDNASGCRDSLTINIFTANPTLTNPDTFLCRNSITYFTLQNNYTNPAALYTWEVLGLPTASNSSPITNFAASVFGNFTNSYVVIDNNPQYCKDSIRLSQLISVRGPNLSYTVPASICSKNIFTINNTSTPYQAADNIISWSWNYGLDANQKDTVYQPASYVYNAAGGYNVKLIAKDKKGCVDSLIKNVVVLTSPFLRVFPRTDSICQGQSDSLFAFHSDTLLWSPAALLSCANCDTTIATPTSSTIFYATAKNNIGCSIRDSSIITVYEPFTATASAALYGCVNDTVRLSAKPLGKKILWSPSIGLSDSSAYNPLVTIKNSENYIALLADSVGCFTSTATVKVIAKSLPIVNAGVDITLPVNNTFTIAPTYSSNVVSYEWTPAGNLSCTTCASPSGIAENTKAYTIKATSDSGCVGKDDINIFVLCEYANLYLPSAFSPNRDGKNDRYFPIARGITTIVRFTIFNRYGQIVFDAKNTKPNESALGWDGKFKGLDQPADAYVFVLEALCDQGENITKKDSFLLLR
jgi:gliding motility-associated-like protein